MNEVNVFQAGAKPAVQSTTQQSTADERQLEALFYQVVKPAKSTTASLKLQQRTYLNPDDSAAQTGQSPAAL